MSKGLHWTDEQLADFVSRRTLARALMESTPEATERPRTGATAKVATTPRTRGMNKLEARYAVELQLQKMAGDVITWGYESVRLKLAEGAWFLPDFVVWMSSGEIRVDECKGFMREAANVRIKVAASLYPMFHFYILRWHKGEWTRTRVPG